MLRFYVFMCFGICFLAGCDTPQEPIPAIANDNRTESLGKGGGGIELHVLGTIQDAGSPHIGCSKSCCRDLWFKDNADRQVVSLGILDHLDSSYYLIDATPDMPSQIQLLRDRATWKTDKAPDGVFLTHAHIGHYTGLMYFGREALGAREAKIYAMPRMMKFLKENAPWSQLVSLKNIELKPIEADRRIKLSDHLSIKPIRVPHRDELSETVGYMIYGPSKTVLFIPDIDKWRLWSRSILDEIMGVDFAFLDASFYSTAELGHRDPSEIPHPLVEESVELFNRLSDEHKSKIRLIHFNHTNPLLDANSLERKTVSKLGYKLAVMGERYTL